MIRLSVFMIFFGLALYSSGQQPVGSWTDHLSYNSARNLAVGTKELFASTGSTIMVYNLEFAELRKLSRAQGLTESGINTIAFSLSNNSLIIAYSSTNIDLVRNNVVYNIPDIKRKYIPGKKEINKIRTNGNYAYMACSFGIVIADVTKNEIYDTWKPGTSSQIAEVYDIAFSNSKVYAATNMGVFFADAGNLGLSYYGNWNLITTLPVPYAKYTSIIVSANKVYVNRAGGSPGGDYIYLIDTDNSSSLFSYQSGIINLSFDPYPGGFTVTSATSVRIFRDDGSLVKTITAFGSGTPNISQALIVNQDIWIADINAGLIRGENMSFFNNLVLPGPKSNDVINLSSGNGSTFISGGAVDNSWNNLWRPFQVYIHQNNNWNSIVSSSLKDAMRVLPDPDNPAHFFVSTWGMGLMEYEDNVLMHQYDDSNSPLKTIVPGAPYSRICGLAMDKSKNLWLTQSGVPGTIKILKPDGTWIINPVTIDAPTIGDIIITKSGHKWIVLPRGFGLFVLDDNNTPENFTDDRFKTMLVKDTENKVFSNISCIAEDLDGNIWVGTDQGPVVYFNPEKIFDEDPRAFRIKFSRNDGTGLSDYMLGTEVISSIAIDGANRKWLGTINSGAYLFSSDGTTQILNYNEENSPMLSNSVATMAIDNKSGEVWFGTAKGVISVRGDATSGAEKFRNVYTFPNPVREDYSGKVTITGLMRNSQIKITDISGNLVYEMNSEGGQASWDLKTYNGKRVSTGVYLVFCSSEDGSQSFVTKMLVIK
jgi:hypothetical protein